MVRGWKAKLVEASPKVPGKKLVPSVQVSEVEACVTDVEVADMCVPVSLFIFLAL
jgi:hypothetical protein